MATISEINYFQSERIRALAGDKSLIDFVDWARVECRYREHTYKWLSTVAARLAFEGYTRVTDVPLNLLEELVGRAEERGRVRAYDEGGHADGESPSRAVDS